MAGNFWDSASEGFNRGVPLGMRMADQAREEERWKKEQGLREKQDTRAQQSHEKTMKLTDIQVEEATDKQTHRKVKQGIGQMVGLLNVGEEDAALQLAQVMYRQLYPDGKDVRVFSRNWNSEDKIWEKQDKDTNFLVVTGREGEAASPVPFKSAKDVIDIFTPYLDYDKYAEDMKELRKQRNEFNGKQESFVGEDGKRYVKQMNEKGEVGTVEFTGPVRESILKQRKREASEAGLSKGDTRIAMGLSKPEGASEAAKNMAQADKARLEISEIKKGGGKGSTKEALANFKTTMEIALMPFVSKGKPVLNPETMEMTENGENGLKVARALLTKAKNTPNALTEADLANLQDAEEAVNLYGAIKTAMGIRTPSGVDPAKINKRIKDLGLVQDPKTGKWGKPSSAAPGTPQVQAAGVPGPRGALDTRTAADRASAARTKEKTKDVMGMLEGADPDTGSSLGSSLKKLWGDWSNLISGGTRKRLLTDLNMQQRATDLERQGKADKDIAAILEKEFGEAFR